MHGQCGTGKHPVQSMAVRRTASARRCECHIHGGLLWQTKCGKCVGRCRSFSVDSSVKQRMHARPCKDNKDRMSLCCGATLRLCQ